MWKRTSEIFLRIAREKLAPELLLNVAGVYIGSAEDEESAKATETEKEKAKVPQNKKK